VCIYIHSFENGFQGVAERLTILTSCKSAAGSLLIYHGNSPSPSPAVAFYFLGHNNHHAISTGSH
jgi:hypothetical protein